MAATSYAAAEYASIRTHSSHSAAGDSPRYGFLWKCRVPHCTQSGFADHYPVFKWLAISLGILTQHFQLPTHFLIFPMNCLIFPYINHYNWGYTPFSDIPLDGFMMFTTPRRRSYHAFVSWKRQMIGSLAPSCWNSRLKGDVIYGLCFWLIGHGKNMGKTIKSINTWAPGMRFADTGRTWAKDGKRGGYLSISLHMHVVQ